MKANKTNPVYYKAIDTISLKADKETRKVSGFLAAFNNVDSMGDMLIKGCFAKSISERGPASTTHGKIAYLWMHQMDEPIGHFTKLEETEEGLYFEAYVDKVEKGDEVLEQYASGTLNQHSIGYRYVWDKCKFETRKGPDGEDMQVFVCYELKLFEGSVVTLGANENTPFTGFKSDQIEDERKKLIRETETFVKDLDPEQQYKIRQLISKHIALHEADSEPGKPLPEPVEPQTDYSKVAKAILLTI